MKQEKLEEKVRELFERQNFDVRELENGLNAEKEDQELILKVFSSEEFSVKDIENKFSEGQKVFVDEGLEDVQDYIEDVSVIREDDGGKDYDLPSYELVGELAIINELTVDEDEAIEGILEHHPSVKTILLKEEPLHGEFRVGEYRKLYGSETETIHKEFGCRFKVDPTEVYYSERFSTERKRVIDQIEDDEKVLVLFAGVGPFAIMAAKLANPEKVVAIEKNPAAADYLKQNIELNNVENVVQGYEGDVRDIIPELEDKFDRIIMPLPEKAEEFLDDAKNVLADSGVVHLYRFEEESADRNFSLKLERKVNSGWKNPAVERVCLDLRNV